MSVVGDGQLTVVHGYMLGFSDHILVMQPQLFSIRFHILMCHAPVGPKSISFSSSPAVVHNFLLLFFWLFRVGVGPKRDMTFLVLTALEACFGAAGACFLLRFTQ